MEKALELVYRLTGKSVREIASPIDSRTARTLAPQLTQVIVGYWRSDTEDKDTVL